MPRNDLLKEEKPIDEMEEIINDTEKILSDTGEKQKEEKYDESVLGKKVVPVVFFICNIKEK